MTAAPREAPWREQRAAVAVALAEAGIEAPEAEARWLCEEASGHDAAEWPEVAGDRPADRAHARLWLMVGRRLAGEPLQYVLGAWPFRGLDLMVDRRVLIPRPETEVVVEVALEEAARQGLRRGRRRPIEGETVAVVADLGTGSGAIALALESELPDVEVWATDASDDALAVARANTAGCRATRVRLATGDWFAALPVDLCGRLLLIVSNPPYVAEHEVATLPREVADHEPRAALVSGPTGLEDLHRLIAEALAWLAPGGALVCEIAPHQAEAVAEAARAAGYEAVEVHDDLTGRPRVLLARRPRSRAGIVEGEPIAERADDLLGGFGET